MRTLQSLCALSLGVLILAACDDNDVASTTVVDAAVTAPPPVVGRMDAGTPSEPPVYVLMTQIPNVDDRDVYYPLLSTLDPTTPEVSIADAPMFPGVANFAAIGGKVFVSSGEEPKITRFEITRDLKWKEEGSISFGAYPLGDNANFFSHWIIDAQNVVLPFEQTNRLVWNPSALTIVKTFDGASMLPAMRGGDTLNATGNRLSSRQSSNLMQLYFYTTPADRYADTSQVISYDAAFEEKSVIDVPCPGLDLLSRAEDGTTYLSSAHNTPFLALAGQAPRPCVARLTPAGALDTAWTTDLTGITGGRHVMGFRYLADGKALANVIDHEAFGVPFNAETDDEALEERLWEGGFAHLWLFDLRANTGKQLDGIPGPQMPRFQTSTVDGRAFFFATTPDRARTDTYEIGLDGTVTQKFSVKGEVYKLERLR